MASLRDTVRLRFKTNHENGVILYSRGSQGDYIALQLVENRLLLNINLGHKEETSMALGSLLDDNLFHEVMISRERRDVILSVDRVRTRDRIKGDFHKLNLDRDLYIGGVPHVEEGLVVFENFTGCIENMYLNHSNVIAGGSTHYFYLAFLASKVVQNVFNLLKRSFKSGCRVARLDSSAKKCRDSAFLLKTWPFSNLKI